MLFEFYFFAGFDEPDDNLTVEASSYEEAEKIACTKMRKREYIPSLTFTEDNLKLFADAENVFPFTYAETHGYIKADQHKYVRLNKLTCDGQEISFNKRG